MYGRRERMSVVGRQMARSNSTAHHQRQHSDNFLDASFSSKWLQSSHFPSSQVFDLFLSLSLSFFTSTFCIYCNGVVSFLCCLVRSSGFTAGEEWAGSRRSREHRRLIRGRRAWGRTTMNTCLQVSSAPVYWICIHSILSCFPWFYSISSIRLKLPGFVLTHGYLDLISCVLIEYKS